MQSCHIAIVGGGVIGASIAAHLARTGVKDILLIERAPQLGTGTTARASGGVRHQFSTEIHIRCTLESMKEISHFRELYDVDLHFRPVGYLMLATERATAELLQKNTKLQNRWGIPTHILNDDEIRAIFPKLSTDGVLTATFCSSDGVADPHNMVEGYAGFARSRGVTLMLETTIASVAIKKTSRIELTTTRGETIEAENVVFATGPYSLELLHGLGFQAPITPHRKLVFQTTLPEGISDRSPFTIEFPSGWYMKYDAQTLLMGMSQSEDSAIGDERVNLERAEPVVAAGIKRYPPLAQSRLIRGLAGLSDATPDHHAILGKLPGHKNVYLALGFSGHGFQHAPVVGKLMTEILLEREAKTLDITPFSPDRFTSGKLQVDPLVVT